MHVYRWDLDKTYLDTDFDSWRGLLRTAREPAHEKRSLPGATALVRALARRKANRICIVSGSPTQLRAKLEEKLRLDQVQVHSLTLKDSVRHLRHGRLRAVKDQFGYKLPVLLADRVGLGAAVHETLFGDDAEVDALVYSMYADAVAGRLGPAEVSRVLEVAGAYEDSIERALEALARIPHAEAVDRIFIRQERGHPLKGYEPLGPRVVPVRSWWQAALVLSERDELSAADAGEVFVAVDHDAWSAAGLVQELVLQGHLSREAALGAAVPEPVAGEIARALERVRASAPAAAPPSAVPDYLALVKERLEAKKRRRSRRGGRQDR